MQFTNIDAFNALPFDADNTNASALQADPLLLKLQAALLEIKNDFLELSSSVANASLDSSNAIKSNLIEAIGSLEDELIPLNAELTKANAALATAQTNLSAATTPAAIAQLTSIVQNAQQAVGIAQKNITDKQEEIAKKQTEIEAINEEIKAKEATIKSNIELQQAQSMVQSASNVIESINIAQTSTQNLNQQLESISGTREELESVMKEDETQLKEFQRIKEQSLQKIKDIEEGREKNFSSDKAKQEVLTYQIAFVKDCDLQINAKTANIERIKNSLVAMDEDFTNVQSTIDSVKPTINQEILVNVAGEVKQANNQVIKSTAAVAMAETKVYEIQQKVDAATDPVEIAKHEAELAAAKLLSDQQYGKAMEAKSTLQNAVTIFESKKAEVIAPPVSPKTSEFEYTDKIAKAKKAVSDAEAKKKYHNDIVAEYQSKLDIEAVKYAGKFDVYDISPDNVAFMNGVIPGVSVGIVAINNMIYANLRESTYAHNEIIWAKNDLKSAIEAYNSRN